MSVASTTNNNHNNNLAYAYIRDSPSHGAQTAERVGEAGGKTKPQNNRTTLTALEIGKQSTSGGQQTQQMRSTMP